MSTIAACELVWCGEVPPLSTGSLKLLLREAVYVVPVLLLVVAVSAVVVVVENKVVVV